MSEQLEIFDLDGKSLGFQDRQEFYVEIKDEFEKTGQITRQVKRINLILMNFDGKIYLQKRSKSKKENPGLYDKTVGGHVLKGHSCNLTVIKECAEELGFPAAVLSDQEFNEAIHEVDLKVVGVFRKVEEVMNLSVRIDRGGRFDQPYITSIYFGYYDGTIKFADGESSGLEVFSKSELSEELSANPDKFTEDLKYIFEKYNKYFYPIKIIEE